MSTWALRVISRAHKCNKRSFWLQALSPQPTNPQPSTLNPKPKALNPKPLTLSPKPATQSSPEMAAKTKAAEEPKLDSAGDTKTMLAFISGGLGYRV